MPTVLLAEQLLVAALQIYQQIAANHSGARTVDQIVAYTTSANQRVIDEITKERQTP